MNYDEFDFNTRCRAIFVASLGLLNPFVEYLDLGENFFLNLQEFAKYKIRENRKNMATVLMIVPHKKENNKLVFYENEETVMSLMTLLSSFHSLDQYSELLDSVDQKIVDRISDLAAEYQAYMYSFFDDYTLSLLPKLPQ